MHFILANIHHHIERGGKIALASEKNLWDFSKKKRSKYNLVITFFVPFEEETMAP